MYGRFVLSHMIDPVEVAALMVAAVRPGGVVAVEDTHIAGAACFPPSGAFERTNELYSALVRSRGGDPDIGLRLAGILGAVGLVDLDVSVVQPAAVRGGDAKQVQLPRCGTSARPPSPADSTTPTRSTRSQPSSSATSGAPTPSSRRRGSCSAGAVRPAG